jgi:hypothetical protein
MTDDPVQKMTFTQSDGRLSVSLTASQHDSHTWANSQDLLISLQKMIHCAENWPHFDLRITNSCQRDDEDE